MRADRVVIACNLTEGISEASKGSLAYVCQTNGGGGNDRIVVLLRSRGGRWIYKWESMKRLGNFRNKTLPPTHPRHRDRRILDHSISTLNRLIGANIRLAAPKEGE